MDLQLKGKTALVTGSTAGIGLAIARRLAGEGVEVVITGRERKKLEAAAADIGAAGQVRAILADAATAAGAATLIAAAPDVDILVNNLGIYEARPFVEISDEEWHRIFEVNVVSGARLARHYFPRMLARKWGRIIFIASETALQPTSDMIHYSMTKTAQLAIARGLAEQTRGTSVTVNSVMPGPTRSEGIVDFIRSVVDNGCFRSRARGRVSRLRPLSLIGRLIEADEIGSIVTYLASPLAAVTNGAAIRAEGGILPTIA